MKSSHLVLSLFVSVASSYATLAAAEDQKTLNPTVVDAKDKPAAATSETHAADAGAAAATNADSTTCTQGQANRVVELSFGDAAKKLPCAVHYKKATEQPGHDQVLFKADHDLAFCQSKMQAFVEKLSQMGWNCKG